TREAAGEGEVAEQAGVGGEPAIVEPLQLFDAEFHGVPAAHPGEVVGELRVAVVHRVEQALRGHVEPRDVDVRNALDAHASGQQSGDAELIDQRLPLDVGVRGGDQDHDTRAEFVEQVRPDAVDITEGPEVHAADIGRSADGRGRQRAARAGD